MPSWVTYEHLCTNCGEQQTETHDRADIQDFVYCNACHRDTAERIISANVSTSKTSASIPDGTRRFDGVRREQEAKRWLQSAKARGDVTEIKKARAEQRKLRSKSK